MTGNNSNNKGKKLVQINSVCNGSTGKIMGEIQKCATKNGYTCISFYGRRKGFKNLNSTKINSEFFVYLHGALTFLFNHHGRYSFFQTKRLVKKLRKINPDIIQLHNIHGYYLNYKVLFKYLKNDFKGKVFWTLHDCWPFTGHCAYFDYVQCNNWLMCCKNCPQIKKYPVSLFFDTSKSEYICKRDLFNGVKDLTIIAPSKWLANLVAKSYLNNYNVKVINNGIDLNIFKQVIDSDVKIKYGIEEGKKIVLGVSNVWEDRKGLNDFIDMSSIISKNIQIVLVGLTEKQIHKLPGNIIGITRTDNQEDLVKLYSIADVFVNPTKEDNYPTVNIESIACGTPVLTYDTGGCKEQIYKNTGFVCKNYSELVDKLEYCIENDYKHKKFDNSKIIDRLDSNKCYEQYIKLYNGSDKK